MSSSRITAVASICLSLLVPTLSMAQSVTTPKTDTTTRSDGLKSGMEPSSVADVEKWTNKQWQAAKLEWAKDKVKWTACREQSAQQKLAGRKSWTFLYTCMTT